MSKKGGEAPQGELTPEGAMDLAAGVDQAKAGETPPQPEILSPGDQAALKRIMDGISPEELAAAREAVLRG